MFDLKMFQYQGKFLMLALDHRGSFRKYVNPASPDSVTDEELIKTKAMIIESMQDQFSGVLLDVEWGLVGYKSRNKPYLLPLEKSGYTDFAGERATELERSAKELKVLGASGAKLLIYFNPEAANSASQLEVAQAAIADCRQNDLPIFLEIVTYGNEAKNKSRGQWVIKSLEMFLKYNVVPDVWKLEYPTNFSTCRQITKLVGEAPWILLTRGETFKIFAKQLKDAVAAGAVGFLAGRALWQEIAEHKTNEAKKFFLETTVKERFRIISDIVLAK